jgi:DNA-binding NtrC family response regulator
MLDAITPKTTVGEVIPPKLEYVGESDKARRLRERMQEAAHTESPVLIYGEAGTGKAHAAKIIHAASRRASPPFVQHNSEVHVENNDVEVFGLEQTEVGGTVKRGVLEMAPETQHRLHSYLNDGYFTRIIGVQPVYSNVRVMVATNVDLGMEVKAGRFRADLYDQLSVCLLETSTLRDTLEDLPLLAQYYAEKQLEGSGSPPKISEMVLDKLKEYAWPRNFAELARVIGEAVIRSPVGIFSFGCIPMQVLWAMVRPVCGLIIVWWLRQLESSVTILLGRIHA